MQSEGVREVSPVTPVVMDNEKLRPKDNSYILQIRETHFRENLFHSRQWRFSDMHLFKQTCFGVRGLDTHAQKYLASYLPRP